MRNVVIVCGAGASSTFVAHRLRARASERDIAASFRAETLEGLDRALSEAEIVLVGAHLAPVFDSLRLRAEAAGAAAVLLPIDVLGARGTDSALDLVSGLSTAPAAGSTGAGSAPGPHAGATGP